MTDCTIWLGTVTNSGYGQTPRNGDRSRLAHRAAWEAAHGPIAPGLQVDHLCRNKLCVNVDHLEVVTQSVNVNRAYRARPRPLVGRIVCIEAYSE